jgi:hypothetical protein
MADVVIKNVTEDDLYITDLNDTIEAGETTTIKRSLGELTGMYVFNQALADGRLSLISITPAPNEAFWVAGASDATTANLTLYVNAATGNDGNDGKTPTTAFLTIQKAIDSLPDRIRHRVSINVAAGNYAGFSIIGFIIDPAAGVTTCGITILGAYTNASVATGTATGTFTSTTTGSSATVTYTVLGDTGQNWTVNDLRGKVLEVLTGTSAGSIIPIVSNTANTLTLASTSAVGSVGGTYAIRDWASVINTPVTVPGSMTSATTNSPPINVGIAVRNNLIGVTNSVVIEGMKVNLSVAGNSISSDGNTGQMFFNRCCVTGAATGLTVRGGNGSSTSFSSSVMNINSALSGIVLNGSACGFSANNSLIRALAPAGGTGAFQVQGSSVIVGLNNSVVENFSFGMKLLGHYGALVQMSGTTIDCAGQSQGILASPLGHSDWGGTILQANGLELRNCSAGISLGGPTNIAWMVGLKGTGNVTGLLLERGAKLNIDATSTITGATEISMDGVATTLATMRAQTPRMLSNNYGTRIEE